MRRLPNAFDSGVPVSLRRKPAGKTTVYFGSGDGKLRSYDETGVSMVAQIDEPITCLMQHDEFLHFGSAAGDVYSYNLKTREQKRVVELVEWGPIGYGAIHRKTVGVTCMAELEGNLYIGCTSGAYSYRPGMKRPKRIAKTKERVSCMAEFDGILYFGYGWELHSYNPNRLFGKQKRACSFAGLIECLAPHDGLLYFGAKTGDFYSYDPMTRGRKYLLPFINGSLDCMVGSKNDLYIGDGPGTSHGPRPYLPSNFTHNPLPNTGALFAYNGSLREVARVKDAICCIAEKDNMIYFASKDRRLHVFNPGTSECKQIAEVDSNISCIIATKTPCSDG